MRDSLSDGLLVGVITLVVVVLSYIGVLTGRVGAGNLIEQACLKQQYVTINNSVYKCSLDTEIEAVMTIKKSGEM